ncbi:MAG TPA: helix-turn-helix domain-containing protein, partial [Rhodothermales bacterium]|nr:helix-turn-helix domain-containing protein [Rhodothermales bacterium]
FVRRVREERARELLEEGAAPAETAHALGFADQAHLTRALRTRFGRTPGQIRRAARDRAAGGHAAGDAEGAPPA